MAARIDFAAIKAALPIERVAEYLGLPATPKDQIRCACPACETENERALVITKSKESYYCFSEKRGGDCIALTAHIKGIGQREAAELLQRDLLGTDSSRKQSRSGTDSSRDRRTQGERQPRQNDSPPAGMPPLDYLEPAHEDVEALGMSAEDAELLGAGYANKGVLRGLVAVPLRTAEGVLVGYAGIAEGRVGKLHIPKPNIVPFAKRRA